MSGHELARIESGGSPQRMGAIPRHLRFAEAYVATNCDSVKAARAAGYQGDDITLRIMGNRLLRHPKVRPLIEQAWQAAVVTPQEIGARLAAMARADALEVLACCETDETGARRLNLDKARAAGLGRVIRSVKPGPQGDIIELHDSQRALETLAKIAGLLRDRVDVHASVDVATLSLDQLAALAAGKRPSEV